MNTKKEYIAPKLTEFSYKSEEGFALSLMNMLESDEFDNCNQEKWDYDEDNHFGNQSWDEWDN